MVSDDVAVVLGSGTGIEALCQDYRVRRDLFDAGGFNLREPEIKAGAKEVHVRVASPPTTGPCYYGIDTPTKEELIANRYDIERICKYIEADSLGYLGLEGLLERFG